MYCELYAVGTARLLACDLFDREEEQQQGQIVNNQPEVGMVITNLRKKSLNPRKILFRRFKTTEKNFPSQQTQKESFIRKLHSLALFRVVAAALIDRIHFRRPPCATYNRLLPCYAQCQNSQPLCQNKYFNQSIPALQIKKLQYQNKYFNKFFPDLQIKNYNVRMNISINPFLLANEKTITFNIHQFFMQFLNGQIFSL